MIFENILYLRWALCVVMSVRRTRICEQQINFLVAMQMLKVRQTRQTVWNLRKRQEQGE